MAMVSNFKFIPYVNILQNFAQNVRKQKWPSILSWSVRTLLTSVGTSFTRVPHRFIESKTFTLCWMVSLSTNGTDVWFSNSNADHHQKQVLRPTYERFMIFNFFFFLKFFGGHMSFLGATGTPVLDFWWRLLWVSKPEWVLPYSLFLRRRM